MQAKAYVLVQVAAGQIAEVLAVLRQLPGVSMADAVIGPYDVIVVVQLPTARDIGLLVMNQIHGIPGVKQTTTCLTV
ncbi:MAG: AsnC family transcriptional regulator [Herpetosiphonaceae bacterium]|nr:MAG: AsnC family transcriptional regulator [Herpetosiphonaceae bacterium]